MWLKALLPYIISSASMSSMILLIEHVSTINPNPLLLLTPLIGALYGEYIVNNKLVLTSKVIFATYLCMIIPFGGAYFGSPNKKILTYIKLILIALFGGLFYGIIIELIIMLYHNYKN